MASIIPPDLDACLEALDRADSAVREVYRKLADDPDLAAEYEAGLRELHAKRNELARDVGMVTLAQWRSARSSAETIESDSTATTPSEPASPAPNDERETDGASSAMALTETPARSDPEPATAVASAESPPPVERPESIPVPPPATDAQLAQWKQSVVSKGLGGTATPSPTVTPAPPAQRPWPVTLHEMMCLLGPRETDLDDAVALVDELDALDEVATPQRQTQWVRLPIEVQKHWLSHLVARTRAMRDHPSSESVLGRLKVIRAVYPQWAREFVPGHINGLQLKHAPMRETWASDADDHWQALVAVVVHELPAARKSPPTRRKKERTVVEEEPTLVEAGWPLLPVVRGKTAVIVGGAPKEPNRDRLETYLRLATLEWPVIDGPRKVEAVAQRIVKGAYDVVIVIQTQIGHPEAERILDAAKASRTRWATVDGYGVTAVRAGLERFVKPPTQARQEGEHP